MMFCKCKLCGGKIDAEGTAVVFCAYCGTKQTLPRLGNDSLAQMYDMADSFRRNAEYERASEIFLRMLQTDSTDAEIYWSLVLCRYGVAYHKDAVNGKWMTVVTKPSQGSVFDDEYYKKVMEYADDASLAVYRDGARQINEAMRRETASAVNTAEAVLSAEMCNSPILDRAFIFIEDSEWAKGEEYCERILNDQPRNAMAYVGKLLIDLKVNKIEELENCKWSFAQNDNYKKAVRFGDTALQTKLNSYIEHIIERNKNEQYEKMYSAAVSVMGDMTDEMRLKRAAEEFARIGHYKNSGELRDKCLETARELHQQKIYMSAMKLAENKYDVNSLNKAAEEFGRISGYKDSEELKEQCLSEAHQLRQSMIYKSAVNLMNFNTDESKLRKAAQDLESIAGYKDSDELRAQCLEMADEAAKDTFYNTAAAKMNENTEKSLMEAKEIFASLGDWKNSAELISECDRLALQLAEDKEKEKAKREKNKKTVKSLLIAAAVTLPVIAIAVVLVTELLVPTLKYNNAVELYEKEEYVEAIGIFRALGDYKDSSARIMDCRYGMAQDLFEEKKYSDAIRAFERLEGYSDSNDRICECRGIYIMQYIEKEDYTSLKPLVDTLVKGEGSEEAKSTWLKKICDALYKNMKACMDSKDYDKCISFVDLLYTMPDIEKHIEGINEEVYTLAGQMNKSEEYGLALMLYLHLGDYRISADMVDQIIEMLNITKPVSTNTSSLLAVKEDGTVYYEGFNFDGRGDVSDWKDIICVASGNKHSVGLKADGTVLATGSNENGQCDVSGWEDIISITAGNDSTAGLKKDGTVVTTDSDLEDEISSWEGIIAIEAEYSDIIGLRADGTVVSTDYYGHDTWNSIIDIAASNFGCYAGLKADGTVLLLGFDEDVSEEVGKWKNIIDVAVGYSFVVGLKADGTVLVAGNNEGYLEGTTLGHENMKNWENIVAIYANDCNTVGVKADGTILVAGLEEVATSYTEDWENIIVRPR